MSISASPNASESNSDNDFVPKSVFVFTRGLGLSAQVQDTPSVGNTSKNADINTATPLDDEEYVVISSPSESNSPDKCTDGKQALDTGLSISPGIDGILALVPSTATGGRAPLTSGSAVDSSLEEEAIVPSFGKQ
jgi:hypothetical protein